MLVERVALADVEYFHDSVQAVIWEAGMLQPAAAHE